MSLKNLPKISALSMPKHLSSEAPETIVARWKPEVRAAKSDNNVITIYDQIGEGFFSEGVTPKRVAAALRAIDSDEVVVSINSPGGDFFDGVAIYNLLREDERKVKVQVVGLAASAASVIAMAADELEIAASGFLMIHNAWAVSVGNRNDFEEAAQTLAAFDSAMADVYAARSGISRNEIAAMMDAETWLGGRDAIDRGFADALLSKDAISDDKEDPARAALRTTEMALAKAGYSRSERRSILGQLKGMPSAAPSAMPSAGNDEALSRALGDLLNTIKS